MRYRVLAAILLICLGCSGESPVAPSASLRGIVTDLDTTERIAGAAVSIPGHTTVSDRNGFFEIPNLAIGETTLQISHADYHVATFRVSPTYPSTPLPRFVLRHK